MTKTKPKSRVGRPRKAGARSRYIKIRLNDEEYGMVLHLLANGGGSYSNIFRAALRLYYHMTHANND